jgi:hypothetical protein
MEATDEDRGLVDDVLARAPSFARTFRRAHKELSGVR